MTSGRALVVDFGGVLTTPVLDSYTTFCETEGIEPSDFRAVIRDAYRTGSADDPIVRLELGLLDPPEFERHLARMLSDRVGRAVTSEDLITRILGLTVPDERMIAAVRSARAAGVPTALLSNSWGRTDYPPEILELFDVAVISARVRLRKPDPAIFTLTTGRLGVAAGACVFVDDARPNCEAASALGMHAILHKDPAETIPRLEDLLGVPLG